MKQKNFFKIAIFFLIAFTTNYSFSQLVTTIDFETANAGYTSSTPIGTGNTDAFNRTDIGVNDNNTFYWVAEDLSGNPSIDLTQINVSGSASFTFMVDFSYDNASQWDSTDELLITYSLDGGTFQNLMAVQHINSDGFNNPASLDLDFDGNGDLGQELSTNSFTTFTTNAITLSSNSTLDIKFQFNNLTSNGEGIFIDNIIITETAAATDPTVTFDAASSSVNELDSDVVVSGGIPVTLTNYAADVTITPTINGSSTAEIGDYTIDLSPITFTGNGTLNIPLTIKDDADFDDETIIIDYTVTTGTADLAVSQHTVTITDDETAPTIGFDTTTSSQTETNSAFNVLIPVTVSGYSGTQIDVNLATSGTAESGDFSLNTTSLSFTANGSQNISLNINNDTDADAETIILTIAETSAVTGLIISQSTHTVTVTDDEIPPVPTAGTIFITEVSDASSSSNEFIELFNSNNFSVDLSTSKLVMLTDGTVFDFDGSDLSTATIPANGFLILTRGSDKTTFEGVFGTLNTNTTFIQGKSSLFFGTGTARRWQLKTGGTNNTDDGTLIDDTEVGIGGSNRHYQNIFTDTYISTSESDANPGKLEYLLYNNGVWVNAEAIDGTTASKDAYFYDNYTVSSNVSVNNIGISSGNSFIVNAAATLTLTGNATYKRNITTPATTGDANLDKLEGWHLMSSPIVGQTYDTTWADANEIASGTAPNRAIATYNNAVASSNWVYSDGSSNSFARGTGYSIKRTATGDVTFTGTLNTGNISDVTITTGTTNFNLVGNPYTAYINSATFLTTNTGFLDSETIWVWDSSTKNYVAKVTGDTFKIAPGQGFFVKASTDGDLTFEEASQSHETDTFLKSSKTEIVLNITNGTSLRFTKIRYQENSSKAFDNGFDGETFNGVANDFDLYTQLLSNNINKNYQVQSLPNSDLENMIIPVGINAKTGKEITFTAEALNLPKALKVYLEDRLTNTFTRLDEVNSNYKINLTEDLNGIGRFYIHTTQSVLSINNDAVLNSISIFKSNPSTLRIAGLPAGNATFKLFNILGKQMMNTSFQSKKTKNITLPKLAKGVYIVTLETVNGELNKKIILE